MGETIDMVPLKQWALRELPASSPLRQVLLSERDEIPSTERAKLEVYWRMYLVERSSR